MTKRHPKPTPEQNAGRLFRKTAKVLEDRKWIKGSIGHKDTGMCARGALTFTLSGRATDSILDDPVMGSSAIQEAERIFVNWMRENYPYFISGIPSWNDAKNTTKEEVILWMNKFADAVDPQRR